MTEYNSDTLTSHMNAPKVVNDITERGIAKI